MSNSTTIASEKLKKPKTCVDKNFHALVIIVVVNLSNILLVVVKGAVAYSTGSFSIGNSTIESFGDVFVGALILVSRLQKKGSCFRKQKFPRGRASESLTNVIASVVMLVLACFNGLISFDNFFENRFDPRLEKEHLFVVAANILLKLFLYLICLWRNDVEQIKVLSKDQKTDILTNSTALVFALLTAYVNQICDIFGAVIIFVLIIYNWLPILLVNSNKIQGIQASDWRVAAVKEALAEVDGCEIQDFLLYHAGEGCVAEVRCAKTGATDIRGAITVKLEELDWIRAVFVEIIDEKNANHATADVPTTTAIGYIDDTGKLLGEAEDMV